MAPRLLESSESSHFTVSYRNKMVIEKIKLSLKSKKKPTKLKYYE